VILEEMSYIGPTEYPSILIPQDFRINNLDNENDSNNQMKSKPNTSEMQQINSSKDPVPRRSVILAQNQIDQSEAIADAQEEARELQRIQQELKKLQSGNTQSSNNTTQSSNTTNNLKSKFSKFLKNKIF
jgi:hypothetical protein